MAAIEKRGENSYRLTVSMGYNKEGKKQFKKRTIDLSHIPVKKRDEEAKKQFTLFENEVKKGQFVDNEKITFEEFIQKWLTDYAKPTLAPKTLSEYKKTLRRITAALGHVKLIQLQPTHLTSFYNNLREGGMRLDKKYISKDNFEEIISKKGFTLNDISLKCDVSKSVIKSIKEQHSIQSSSATKISTSTGIKLNQLFDTVDANATLSEKSILNHHSLICSILNIAMQWGYILNNPALRVTPPKVTKKEGRHYNVEESAYIFQLLEYEPIKYRTMITLAVYGGFRQGELVALTWNDIDFENCLIRVDKSLQHLPEEGTFVKSTKNENIRIISISSSVIGLLKEYKKWQNLEKLSQGNLWTKTDNIFTGVSGGPIYPNTISNWFLKFIRKHNKSITNDSSIREEDKGKYLLREVNFHGLRHTSATLLINQGTDIATVSKRLGHTRISTTSDIYTHPLQKADVEASNKLENLFNKKDKNKKQG